LSFYLILGPLRQKVTDPTGSGSTTLEIITIKYLKRPRGVKTKNHELPHENVRMGKKLANRHQDAMVMSGKYETPQLTIRYQKERETFAFKQK
jgi:hypothetical protein